MVVGLVVVALSMVSAQLNSVVLAQSSQDVCGRLRMAVSSGSEIEYECYRPPNATLSQGDYKECANHPAETKCCPLDFSCTEPDPIPTVACGDETTYIKGTKQCSCGVEDTLPNGQVCCGYFDPSNPSDRCKTSDTRVRTCGDTTTVTYGVSPPSSSCSCGDWFRTGSSISAGDTYCCGIQDLNNPTACRRSQQYSCGDAITPSGSTIPSCECKNTSGATQTELLPNGSLCCGWEDSSQTDRCGAVNPGTPSGPVSCGNTFTGARQCGCKNSAGQTQQENMGNGVWCCGYVANGICRSPSPSVPNPDPPPGGGTVPDPGEGGNEGAGPTLNIFAGPSSDDFAFLNPLRMFSTPALADQFSSPAGIINRILLFAFPLAGLILFVMIVWGGFEMITGATSSKSMEAGKQRITAALIGFFLLFASFWIIQIVEYIFNIAIL